jgi:group II intron reverse transcriptase/maturase
MFTQLRKVALKARSDPKVRFTSLAHILSPEFLRETWAKMNRQATYGVDGETIQKFEEDLESRLESIHERLRKGTYQAPPVRRVEIPKGEGKLRPLGIPTVEDRLVQAAVAWILSVLYEPLFCETSFGYRPGRSGHDALRRLRSHLIADKIMHVYDADIREYFERVNHEWLRRMLAERIADPKLLRLIDKWLRAGVMANGLVTRSDDGVPQGGPISPILANVYLHYALDLWFERKFKPCCRGEAHLVRFADDFVVGFQYADDIGRFSRELPARLRKFHLELSPEKTRQLLFGRFARERLASQGKRPDTFVFLGFKHVCGVDRSGRFAVIRRPSQKSRRKFLDRTKQWLREHMHWKVRDQQTRLSRMLQGYYQYFALPHCGSKLMDIRSEVFRQWRRTLMHRSQRSQTHWSYLCQQAWFDLPTPVSLHRDV